MLYIMRLRNGDCIMASACDEPAALEFAGHLANEEGETVVSIRELSRLGVRLSPNDQASLEVHSWDDHTLDDVLVNEYPALNEAFRVANKIPFTAAAAGGDAIDQLRQAHEENAEIIRKGLRKEQQRFTSEPAMKWRRAAQR